MSSPAALSPTRALCQLLAQPQVVNSCALAVVQQPGAIEAFVVLSAHLKPVEAARFSLYLSRHLPQEAALQDTLCNTYAAVAQASNWASAFMLLKETHNTLVPSQPMFSTVASELKNLEARTRRRAKPHVAQLRRAMLGQYADL